MDFQKAFDSTDQRWLFRVLQKMNFPTHFIRIIQSLNDNANVKVLVNGFQTQNIPIRKGVRQGDPLSLYLLLLEAEPLVATINNHQNIEGLGKGRKRNIKCPSYADDMTLTLFGSRSVVLAFEIIQNFSEATGLKLNIQKTQGMAVDSSCINNLLPSINWQNDSIKILGLKVGRLNSKTIWKDALENLRAQKLSITVSFQTWQAKYLLAKAKLLPQLTYTARTYPLNTATQRVIETEFLNYLTNNTIIQLCMRNLQRPTISGGIKYPNPIIYSNLFYISNLFECFKTRKNDLPFNSNTYLIEYEIGLVLSQIYNLRKLNHLPYRDKLTSFYQQSLGILTQYKITLKELQGKINQIYQRLSNSDYIPSKADKFRWKLTSQNILPNYLKTFNYRTVWNLLPFSYELGKCALCKQGQDSAVHLFTKCSITQQIWKFLHEILNHITQKSSTFEILTPINFYFPLQYETYSEEIFLLVTVTNYCIWRTRLEQLNVDPHILNSNIINSKTISAKIFSYFINRTKREKEKADTTFVQTIENIRQHLSKKLQDLI